MREEIRIFRAALPVFWAQQTGLRAKVVALALISWDILGIVWTALVRLPLAFAAQSASRKILPTATGVLTPSETAPFGADLASRVSLRLHSLKPKAAENTAPVGMAYFHRDYCGQAIQWIDGKICVGRANDGLIGPQDIIVSFDTGEDFEAWLAKQSNFKLSGLDHGTPFTDYHHPNNQCITRERLEAFADGRDKRLGPNWSHSSPRAQATKCFLWTNR